MPDPAITLPIRRQVFERANGNCEYCKNLQAYSTAPFSVEHIFNPRTQIREEHFACDETRSRILGLTPAGRATVKCLKMNRVESVNLRMVLVAFGKHPPE